jgi:hypothetical protein
VIGAETGDGSHLLQRRTAFQVFHDVLSDSLEFRPRKNAVRRGRQPLYARAMTDQAIR